LFQLPSRSGSPITSERPRTVSRSAISVVPLRIMPAMAIPIGYCPSAIESCPDFG
jgi:hypothetical protein